jgi:hypothetical protein
VLAPEGVCPLGSVTAVAEPVILRVWVEIRRVEGREIGVGFIVISSRRACVKGDGGLYRTFSMGLK